MVRKLVLKAVMAVVAGQASLVALLVAVDSLRKRRRAPCDGVQRMAHPAISMETSGDVLGLYSNGGDLYEAMLEEIESAERCIFLETYIWKGDEIGRRFVSALERKARQGVEVYVIFDWFANLVVPGWFKRFPEAIHTMVFRPISGPVDLLDLRRYVRDHRKLMVVDNRVGFIGGFNIGSVYTQRWRDTHVRIEGPGVTEIANAFRDLWNANRDGDLPLISPERGRNWNPTINLHRNDPYLRIFPIRGVYLETIDRAESRIYLTQAYFIPDRAFRSTLRDAAQRGVEVEVVLPWNSNHVVADWLARRHFGGLLRAGVRIFCYRDIMIHSKTATVDGTWSTVGTANIDRLSLLGNYEANLEVYSERFAAEMERMFEMDKANAFELTLEKWEARPLWAKLLERALQSLAPFV